MKRGSPTCKSTMVSGDGADNVEDILNVLDGARRLTCGYYPASDLIPVMHVHIQRLTPPTGLIRPLLTALSWNEGTLIDQGLGEILLSKKDRIAFLKRVNFYGMIAKTHDNFASSLLGSQPTLQCLRSLRPFERMKNKL